ncbi:MAG: uracil-DNA glycosylase [Phycisphaerales bacterium]|nr:MAG: uracil-DNA glycosylase [Phycisphaerales bacterium]
MADSHTHRQQINAGKALAQFLETDVLFGVKAIPVVQSVPPDADDSSACDPKEAALKTLDDSEVRVCTRCGLADTRTNTVFGQGSSNARLVFVGEAPGAEEDRQGLAFVGRAGQLLTRMIAAMGLTREQVFICNVLKCRPPNNRDPAPDEISACTPYLMEQITTIAPEVIVALGAPAARTLLDTNQSIGRLRGRFHDFYPSGSPLVGDAIPLMPTYHPAYLLRSPAEKGRAWQDLQAVMAKLGLPPPRR